MNVWVDATAGASGDMLLGALLDVGVPLSVLADAVDAVSPEPVTLRPERVRRAGLAATRCHVEVGDSHAHRTWADVRALLEAAQARPRPGSSRFSGVAAPEERGNPRSTGDSDEAPAPPARGGLKAAVADRARAAFARLAEAEAAVHGQDVESVAFHEVGALDAIADVVGVAAGFAWLAAAGHGSVVVSPVGVGHGHVRAAHGTLPVPVPAVAALLIGAPSHAGPPGAAAAELCTPTGAALLTTLADGWGPQPAMRTSAVGAGAGGRDPEDHANVVRLLVGDPSPDSAPASAPDRPAALLLETNVDDLDPRVWPAVIAALLEEGAGDAWLTPILMKKGRPAHTLSVLVTADRAAAVRARLFRETTAIGLREHPVTKHALDRDFVEVLVEGHPVAIKLARHDGVLVNAQPEHDDVARAAAALGLPVKHVLARAVAAARDLLP